MQNEKTPKPTKILYIVPDNDEDAGTGESLYAYSLGNQLYELQSVPFYADHLNLEDIVRCDEPAETMPVIRELFKRSGNRTMRVIFRDETPDDTCVDIIWELGQRKIFSEKVAHKRFMFNVPPTSDYTWAQNFLRDKESAGLLWLYEQLR